MNRIILLITCLGQSCVVASAHPPTGIVVDKDGNTYVTDLEAVWKLDNKGELQVIRAGVSGRHVHELRKCLRRGRRQSAAPEDRSQS